VLLAPCYVGYDATQGWQNWMVSNGVNNCRAYGQFLGQRYGGKANIIWLEDGDNGDSTYFPYVEAIAAGIGDYDTSHLQTAKLWPEESVPDLLSGQSWLGLNTTYAYGFDGWLYQRRVYDVALACYNRTPVMATFLVESTYEDASYGSPPAPTGTAYMVRRQAYWAVLSGCSGQVSGDWYVWPFLSGWQAALNSPGYVAMSYLNGLFGSRAWYAMVPDQSHSVVTSGYGTFGQDDYVTAEWATDGSTLIAYVPTPRKLSVDMTKLGGPVTARWFDPTSGTYAGISGSPFNNAGAQTFTPPGNNSAGAGDWVLVLEATPGAIAPAPGAYSGLFSEPDQARQDSSGFFAASVTAKGRYSGYLLIGSRRYGFSGSLGSQAAITNRIVRKGSSPLDLNLSFGAGDQGGQILGYVTNETWVAALLANRAVFNSRTNPAPYTNRFTLSIPGQDMGSAAPAGAGFGALRVNANGTGLLVGMLADGTAISQAFSVSRGGAWPLYRPLYSGNGSAWCWMMFTNEAADDLRGALSWIKPANPRMRYYPGGFSNSTYAVGSKYSPPVSAANLVLNFTNPSLVFGGGNLAAAFTNAVGIGPASRVTNLSSSNRLTMSFSLANGTFSGSIVDPASRRSSPFKGAALQKQNGGYGFLLGTNQSSSVVLEP
jgi:hypothetical protein